MLTTQTEISLIENMLTKKAVDSIGVSEQTKKKLKDCFWENITESNTLSELSFLIEAVAWRFMEGNMSGSMFKILKDNAKTRKTFDRLKKFADAKKQVLSND